MQSESERAPAELQDQPDAENASQTLDQELERMAEVFPHTAVLLRKLTKFIRH